MSTHSDRKLLIVLPVFYFGLVGSASAQSASAPVDIITTAAPTSVAVLAGAESPVEIKTLPDAACTVQTSNASKVSGSLTLYADSAGVVRFHARPSSASTKPLQLALQCKVERQTISHSVEVRVASGNEVPSAALGGGGRLSPSTVTGKIRPVLTDDPLGLSQAELTRQGYPPRPDPQQAPGAYAAWLKMVS